MKNNSTCLIRSVQIIYRRVCPILTYFLFVLAIHFTRFVPTRRATQQTPDTTSLLHTTGHRPEEQEQKEEVQEEQ